MKLQSLSMAACLVSIPVVASSFIACGGNGSSASSSGSGGSESTSSSGSSKSTTSGSGASTSSTTSGGGSSSSGASTSSTSGGGSTSTSSASTSSSSGGTTFPAGTICNSTGTPRAAPATLKHLIVILEENKDASDVNGNSSAPYLNSLAAKCGYASAYDDNTFADNLVSCPHYLALTSGSNCDTGLDQTGTGCITDDGDPTSHTLSTTSIFEQVTSWRSYMESMPSACGQTSSGEYGAKHNPAAYYTKLTNCSANDLPIAAVTCSAATANKACTAPNNAFTQDLANDTLAQITFISPNLLNDMHDGTVTQADNWLFTYMPLIFQSQAYLRGEVAVFILWDEQETTTFGGPIPNVFISPYIKAGTAPSMTMNHFAVLRSWENALGISTYLGCASGKQPGTGAACPSGSTTDVRAAFGF